MASIVRRKCDLVQDIDNIRRKKIATFQEKMCDLSTIFHQLNEAHRFLKTTSEAQRCDQLKFFEEIGQYFKKLNYSDHTSTLENDTLMFVYPTAKVYNFVSNFGSINSTTPPKLRPKPGKYLVSQQTDEPEHWLQEEPGRPIYGHNAPVIVAPPKKSFSFAKASNMQGHYSWGICCDKNGNVYVADRINDRIKVHDSEGNFLFMFGQSGSCNGEFNRPCGLAINPEQKLIVIDKDNHRVQVFTLHGTFLRAFGQFGSRVGQFSYPWGVAVNSKGDICVSDSHNHRIQLFDNSGNFLRMFGFNTEQGRSFSTPRGVCFDTTGNLLVTDFENHRVFRIDYKFTNGRFMGREGKGLKEFTRPQGIACDDKGNIIICDSKNSRILLFGPNWKLLLEIESNSQNYEIKIPAGVCLSPTGRIIVTDLGAFDVKVF